MKNVLVALLSAAMLVNYPLHAQEAIQIEIDSAPVEVEIQQPEPAPPQEPVQPTVQAPEPARPPVEESAGFGTLGIALGVAMAGLLAAFAGGGGSGGGTNSTPSHP